MTCEHKTSSKLSIQFGQKMTNPFEKNHKMSDNYYA